MQILSKKKWLKTTNLACYKIESSFTIHSIFKFLLQGRSFWVSVLLSFILKNFWYLISLFVKNINASREKRNADWLFQKYLDQIELCFVIIDASYLKFWLCLIQCILITIIYVITRMLCKIFWEKLRNQATVDKTKNL